MLINHGVGTDPWTLGRPLTEEPDIHPTALVRASDFGRYNRVQRPVERDAGAQPAE